MILTERQKFLTKELLSVDTFVPTKFLASKFGVSLRTIRYDLENIEYFLKENNSELIKSPRKGIMIEFKKPIIEVLNNEGASSKYVLMSNEKREMIAVIRVLLADGYITSEQLSEKLQISKSTTLNIIKDINKELELFDISIKGRPNYGYKFSGEEREIRKYIVEKVIPFIIENKLMGSILKYLPINDEKEIDIIIRQLERLLNLKLSKDESKIIGLRIIFFIKRNIQENNIDRDIERIKKYRSTNIYNKIEVFYKTIIEKFELKYHEEEIVHLTRILVECNALNSILNNEKFASDEDEKLMDVVAEMVELSYKHIKLNECEVEVLVADLMIHLKGTIKRAKLHINAENLILEQIKAKYGDIFIIANEMGKIFNNHYRITLTDDEIGFITMYLCKGMENSKINTMRNILVVCNTGRGAAKLLATRIKNNIPEINIVQVVSMLDLEDQNILKDIDLIISTIKISNVSKKVIVVSPIITSYELSAIREYLYLKDNNFINSNDKGSIESSIISVLKGYMSKGESFEAMEDIINIFKGYSSKTVSYSEELNVNFWEYTAMILVEIGEMLSKIYKEEITQIEFKKILGIFVHITMAIPRWQSKDFVIEQNIKYYKNNYEEKYKIIKESLDKISEMYNIPMKEVEVIPILRYLL